MIYYLANLDMVYVPKNKLCKAIQDYLKKLHRKLILEENIQGVMSIMVENIHKMNSQFSKCTPVTASFWSDNKGDYHISLNIESIVHFSFMKGYIE